MSDGNVEAITPSPRLLVVDDNEDNRYTLILRLEIEGYQDITTADDGKAALELLRTQQFDLVLLDVMMPKSTAIRCWNSSRPKVGCTTFRSS